VPILLTLLIGIMEFGWLVKSSLTVANAAREGARVASLGRSTTDIQTRVQNSVGNLSVVSPNGAVVMRWSDNNGTDGYPYDVTNTGTQNAVFPGKLIKITVRTTNTSLTGFFPFLRNRTVESFATMRRE
jgi:Flp pilus assembly protein TadG